MIARSAENEWDAPRLAMGCADFDPETDLSTGDTLRRADKLMYENKRTGKIEHKRSHKKIT